MDIKKIASEKYPKIFGEGVSMSNAIAQVQREAFISGYNHNRWVSAEEPPEKESKVLVFANDSIFIMWYGLTNKDGYGWFLNDEQVIRPYMMPTHWQPLPQPPKQ